MSRTIQIIISAALLISIASAATQGVSFTTVLAAPASKVFDAATGGTDNAVWGANYKSAVFGPGADNSSAYVYGIQFSSGTTIDKVISRKINTTLVSNGTADTTLASKMGDDVTSSSPITTTSTTLKTAVGLGSLAIAYVGPTSGSNTCPQVFVAIFNGGTGAPVATKQVTSYACSACTSGTASTGVGYTITVNNVFYSNATYYVTWTATKYTETEVASGTATCSPNFPTTKTNAKSQVITSINGVAASSSATLTYTTEVAVVTGTATATNGADPSPTEAQVSAVCGPSNYSNTSTTFYCAYVSAVAAGPLNTWSLVQITNGTAGSPAVIATDTAAGSSYPSTATTYTPAGFVRAITQSGVLLNKADTITASSGAAATYANTLVLYNLTSGASAAAGGVAFPTSITNAVQTGVYAAEGLAWGSNYGIIDHYQSAAAVVTGEITGLQPNGTVVVTKATYGTSSSALWTSNHFVDANGGLWVGAYSYDDSSNLLVSGTLGKLVASTYPTSTFGTVLSSFFALIFVVFALLAF